MILIVEINAPFEIRWGMGHMYNIYLSPNKIKVIKNEKEISITFFKNENKRINNVKK